jgi:multiple sugar transport system ATP-binding protein
MNMVKGTLAGSDGAMFVEFGESRLRVDDAARKARPALAHHEGKEVVVGLRPESMEDAALVPEAPADRRLQVTVDLIEALGSHIVIHFTIDAPIVLTEDTKELAHDVGAEALDDLAAKADEGRSPFVAQLDPRTRVRVGDRIDLLVDTARLHFFDPETGIGIYAD